MVYHKVYRFRMRPTKSQESILNRLAGARRFVWNWALQRWKEHYETTGKSINFNQLSSELTHLKQQPETSWLKESDSQSLQQSLRDLRQAFSNFFAKRSRYPKFKSRKNDPLRFRIPQRVKLSNNKVYVPKVGWVRIRQSQNVVEKTKSATFRCSSDGKWYVSLAVEFEIPDVDLPQINPSQVVGIDLGLKDFAVLSNGIRISAPKFYRKNQRKLAKYQRRLSRRQIGSNRRRKAKLRVAHIHQKIANQRKDFLHKLTTNLVQYDGLCIEDLSLKGLTRTKLAKSFTDAAMGEFRRQLEYKTLWNRKHLTIIDRFYPSSRLCRGCGNINNSLKLSERQWTCDCGMDHDRDLSAAINIRDEGLRILAAGHAERLNARGDCVRLSTESND